MSDVPKMTEEERMFQMYYKGVPQVGVSILNKKISEAVAEIKEKLGTDVEFIDVYRCVSFAMIGIIEAFTKEYEVPQENMESLVTELDSFMGKMIKQDRVMKELYLAPHLLVDMISYQQWRVQYMEDEQSKEVE